MKKTLRITLGLTIALGLSALPASSQVVTNCSEQLLVDMLSRGGPVLMQNCTITVSNPIPIVGSVTLIGAGTNATLSGGNRGRIFHVQPGGSLTVRNLVLTGGRADNGGAVYVEANAQASFSNCLFAANSALGADGLDGFDGPDYNGIGGNGQPGADGAKGLGGAIYNLGDVVVQHCRFFSNNVTGGSGGFGGTGGEGGYAGGDGGRGGNGATGRGGAIYNFETLSVVECSFESNSARGGDGGLGGDGGEGPDPGVAGSGGFGGRGIGGAIYNEGVASIVNVSFLTNSVFGGDSADDGSLNGGNIGGDGYEGGAGFGGAIGNENTLSITNCTLVSNRATGGAGANGGDGRYEAGDGGDGGDAFGGTVHNSGVFWMMNCTLAQSSVVSGTNGVAGTGPAAGRDGSPGSRLGGAILNTASGEFNIKNTIISGSTGAANGYGSFIDHGFNISTDATIAQAATSFKKTLPRLAPLGFNGGPTRTMTLQFNSPAANAGDMEGAPTFDQRNLLRPGTNKLRPDIGALEMQLPVITTNPASILANAGSTVTFASAGVGDQPLVFSWTHDGTKIPGAVSAGLTLTNVGVANQGEYILFVSNAVGGVKSAPAFLTVRIPLISITNQPQSQTVFVGANASFTVAATSAVPLSVQWRSNGIPVRNGTNWTLLLTNVQPSYAADYSAVVTNLYHSVTSGVARLTVLNRVNGSLSSGGTNFTLMFPTQTGVTYVTEFKNTLAAPAWIPIATNLGTGISITNLDPATNMPSRFYRIRTL